MSTETPNTVVPPTPEPLTWGARLKGFAREWIAPVLVAFIALQVVGYVRAPDLPDLAPAFELRDIQGDTVTLEEYRGKTVVLNFWATWCGPCKIEIPSFSKFSRNNPDIPVLGMVADGPVGKVKAFVRAKNMPYRIVMTDQKTLGEYKITTYPTTVVVGPDGKIMALHTGIMFRPQLAWATWKKPWAK